MYCQRCGTEIADDANFCRKCGEVIETKPLAIVSEPAPAPPPDYENGIKKFMMGLVFLVLAIFPIFSSGRFWWWMLFPAAPLLATGLAEFIRARQFSARTQPATLAASSRATRGPLTHASQQELPRARNTGELVPQPPSVTEGTTRLLDDERVRRD